ncbi:uncharacterized protein N7469_005030 [Penicillium citrinum]|uniref:Xylanolytic transcriptional activator regulatory domain-containing protein n=1 Tax=Penicillium citrinum TaxID=5077 RepID=A0A9W9P0S5_PENCI|nr:uncharacterized protein N7469_005030 [Penicillium citrinum]KAJ5233264.1 hypothetical protein N7469_005030 [Penicillium citrinum]
MSAGDALQSTTPATSEDLAERSSPSASRQVEEQPSSNVTGLPTTPSLGDLALQNDPERPQPRLLRSQSGKGELGAWSSEEGITSRQIGSQSVAVYERNNNDSAILPPRQSQVVLMEIFFSRIHPLLPLVDEEDTRSQFENGELPIPLLQSICLVAAKDRSAAPFLFLGSNPTLLPVEKFGQQLYKDAQQNMPNKRDGNRVLIIRILAILSLHEWGPNGPEDSSLTLAQAVHHAQSIGLHLRGPDSESSLKAKSLFWCLWSLDKWNSVVDGRPVLIHDYDHGQKVTDVLPLFEPPFRIWLLIADQLGRVISTYRPRLEGTRDQFPDLSLFEEFVDTAEAWDIEPQLLELQGRQPSRISNLHQSQAILALAAICRRKDIRDLTPIPVSAYTLSLAFSITYRQLQRAKLSSHKVLARENLLIFHQSLKPLCATWWQAAVMVRLGKYALENNPRAVIQDKSGPPLPINNLDERQKIRSAIRNINDSSMDDTASLPNLNDFDNQPAIQDSLNTPEDTINGAAFSSDLDHLFENHDLSALGEESFETFFGNFLDVNFPTCLGEQSLGGYDRLI